MPLKEASWLAASCLTLYKRRDGKQGHQKAEASVDRQEDLVEKAGLGMCVEEAHEDQSRHSYGKKHQSDQSQGGIPQLVVAYARRPATGGNKTRP